MKPCRILVCGNPTIDELETPDDRLVTPGGSALFASCAAAYLGAEVRVLGNVGEDYPPATIARLGAFGLDVSSLRRSAGRSTRFRIKESAGSRRLSLLEPGARIVPLPLGERFDGIHMGPVFQEITLDLVKSLQSQTDFLSADIQGFIRTVSRTKSVRAEPRNIRRLLGKSKMVQASLEEAELQTGSRKPEEILNSLMSSETQFVVLTMGREGSWLGVRKGRPCFVPAFPEPRIVDSTGAGDI